ncbi:MAG: hypothetical protein KAV87_11230 [Desulfobacteraceae bacterium]|nr:hypothetical protein [Desulfobacteraceae bacterium]
MVSKFMERATGPKRFSTKLCVSTEPVNNFFSSLGTLNSLQEKVPESVLGGDIFSLLSQSLQQMLLQPELPEQEKYPVHPQKAGFTPGFESFDGREIASSLQKPLLSEESKSNFSPQLISPESGENTFTITDLESSNRKKERVNSIFVEKLREYWHLTRQGHKEEQHSTTSVPNTLAGVSDRPSFPFVPESKPAQRSWPEKTGVEAAEKISSFISGRNLSVTPHRVQQTINTDLPEKVEIQNVFNIDVKTGGDGDVGSVKGLSEKITDILREQATQHGIDIT